MSRLGIIAGGGMLPQRLIDACRQSGRDFFVLALQGQADEKAFDGLPHGWAKLGATQNAITILKNEKIGAVVMAGHVRRPGIFGMLPDWRTIKVFARLGCKALGDDALLRAVACELEKDGFTVIGAHEIDPSLLTPEGVLTQKQPSATDRADVETGIAAARALGAADRGQAVVAQGGQITARENARGTSDLLRRVRGGVLVKACKPQQDSRVDLPTIGPRTVEQAVAAGLEGIAVEAGRSLILDRDETIAAADRHGLFIMGFKS